MRRQLGGETLAILSLLRRAHADLVQVDLLLDRDELQRAEQADEARDRRGELADRLIQSRILGRVRAAHAQEAEEEPDHLLALLADDAGQLRILAGAGAVDAAAERCLSLRQLIHGVALRGAARGRYSSRNAS